MQFEDLQPAAICSIFCVRFESGGRGGHDHNRNRRKDLALPAPSCFVIVPKKRVHFRFISVECLALFQEPVLVLGHLHDAELNVDLEGAQQVDPDLLFRGKPIAGTFDLFFSIVHANTQNKNTKQENKTWSVPRFASERFVSATADREWMVPRQQPTFDSPSTNLTSFFS